MQASIDTGELPKDWRSANISSIFKKGDKHLPENYRPVSFTSVTCKILEHNYHMQTFNETLRIQQYTNQPKPRIQIMVLVRNTTADYPERLS